MQGFLVRDYQHVPTGWVTWGTPKDRPTSQLSEPISATIWGETKVLADEDSLDGSILDYLGAETLPLTTGVLIGDRGGGDTEQR